LQIKDYPALIDQMSHVLRPGGLLVLLESDFLVADIHRKPILPATNIMQPPWLARFMCFVSMAIKQRGGNIQAGDHMHDWVSQHPAFTDVHCTDHYVGISPWMPNRNPEAQRERHFAAQMRADVTVSTIDPRINH
jgi:hypothetical protein